MPPKPNQAAKPNEIRLTRVYDADVEDVWDAWTDPNKAAKWWGPRGFTLTTHSKDLRPGGIWHYTMHGPDGTDYINKALYHEVVEHQKLVYDHGGNDEQAPLFRVTVLFAETDGRTVMEMTMALPTAEQAEATKKFIRQAGGNATWDRLAEYLGETLSRRNLFVINRSFEAPRDLLFEMWTDPEHFAQWLPPAGMEMQVLQADIRPGGSLGYRMTNHADVNFLGRIDYQEIARPGRLVYTQRFLDEQGGLSRHPKLPIWPGVMLTTVQLVAEDSDATRVTVTWEPHGEVTAAEIEAFRNFRPNVTLGWTGSFDKLETLLATAKSASAL